ncbi:hypothetical protein ACFP3I_23650 [Chryseobacterium arachidis]|uniref:hypothetical protein n=1 Tax=Chryseobacterium arachidis TaxID=1416778 RepID=UPI00360E2732
MYFFILCPSENLFLIFTLKYFYSFSFIISDLVDSFGSFTTQRRVIFRFSPKSTEVSSKVLLLAKNNEIQAPAILCQSKRKIV